MHSAKSHIQNNRERLLKLELERWKEIIVEQYKPEKIILFGSMANKNTKRWSDIDLVIIKKTGKRFLDRVKEVIQYIQPKVGADIIVYIPEEFDSLSKERNFLKNEILKKGIVVYTR